MSLTYDSYAGSDIVRVFVGKERKLYNFHKDLLTSRCPFFEKCLTPWFPEGVSNTVMLEDDNIQAFDHFFNWIYAHSLEVDIKLPFAPVYILADKFCMAEFKNAIVDAAIAYCEDKNPVPIEQCNLLVRHELWDSRLMWFFIQQMTFLVAKDPLLLIMGPKERFMDVFGRRLDDTDNKSVIRRCLVDLEDQLVDNARGKLKSPVELLGRCWFHEHEEILCWRAWDGT